MPFYRAGPMIAAVLLLTAAGDAASQRPAPSVTSYGVRETGEVISGRLVAWEYWSLKMSSCETNKQEVRCVLRVGNGGDTEATICLDNPAMHSGGTERAPAIFIADGISGHGAPAGKSESTTRCLVIPPHEGVELNVRASSAIQTHPTALAIVLRENLATGQLSARATVPIRPSSEKPIP